MAGGWTLRGLLVLACSLIPVFAYTDTSSTRTVNSLQDESRGGQPPLQVRFISIDGGGGASSDGTFTIRGTIGRAQDGNSLGCGEEISNGVWTIVTETDTDPIFGSDFEFDPACE